MRVGLAIATIVLGLSPACSEGTSAPTVPFDGGGLDVIEGDAFFAFDSAGVSTSDGSGTSVVDGQRISGVCETTANPIRERRLTLTTDEVAIRLAGFLWNKPADAALLARAATVVTNKEVGVLALEMQKDRRFTATLDAFAISWLELGSLARAMPKDFSGFDEALATDMVESAQRFVRGVLVDPEASVTSLLTSPAVWVNARLAPLYGLNLVDGAGDWQRLIADPQHRSGVSTLLGRLSVSPHASQRGSWVLKNLLCKGAAPPPPVGAVSELDSQPGSYRQKLERATANPACTGCHRLMDSPGFAFEHFDDAGRFRTNDHEFAIDASGSTSLWSGEAVSFDGSVALMNLIASSCDFQECFARAWLAVAVGSATDETVAQVLSAFRASGARLPYLIMAITETEAFLAP